MNRVERFYHRWYDPSIQMSIEDWCYIGLLLWAGYMAFALGLFIGWLWLLCL